MSAPAKVYQDAVVSMIDRRFVSANGQPVTARAADEALVTIVSTSLRLQLSELRAQGRGGWHVRTRRRQHRLTQLRKYAEAGQMFEVIRVAAQIFVADSVHGPEA